MLSLTSSLNEFTHERWRHLHSDVLCNYFGSANDSSASIYYSHFRWSIFFFDFSLRKSFILKISRTQISIQGEFFYLGTWKYLKKYASYGKNVHNKNFLFSRRKNDCTKIYSIPPRHGVKWFFFKLKNQFKMFK